jgi:hypothetical protein
MLIGCGFGRIAKGVANDKMAHRAVKEGWLHRKEGGGGRNKWQYKWFVLQKDTLLCYHKREDPNPIGSIKLSGVDDISLIGEHGGKQHCLAIVGVKGSKKVYYLSSDSFGTLDEWYTALKAVSGLDCSLKQTKYCTAEVFLNQGIRINGDVNYHILTVLSARISSDKKRRDHLGWYCDRQVALSVVLNLFSQYNWEPVKIYRSSAMSSSDNGIHPVIRVIFTKISDFDREKKKSVYGQHRLEKSKTPDRELITLSDLGQENTLEGTDDELIELMQEFNIPLSLLTLSD